MGKTETEKKNFIPRSIDFFRESWAELKKVHHPTRQETIQATLGVLFMVVVFAVVLGGIDLFVGHIMRWILSLG